MSRRYLLAVLASLMFRFEVAAQSINGDVIRLRTTTLPTLCNTGDLRVNTTGNIFSICVNNVWSKVDNDTAPFAGTASFAVAAGTASFATTSGTASFATLSASASSAGFATTASSAGTASFSTTASASGTASFATTASTSGTAAFATLANTFNGTVAVANGGTGLNSLTAFTVLLGNGSSSPLQLAPGGSGTVLIGSTTPSFTGTPLGLLGLGINDTTSGAALYVKSVNTSSIGFVVKALTNQTADMIEVLDANGVAQMIFTGGGNFKFFHNVVTPTTRFDLRGAVSQSSVNSGNNARYSMFVGEPTSPAATNAGAGIAFGGPQTSTIDLTPYGYIWVNKNNVTSGDVGASMHFATRNNSTGNAQRSLELDSNGAANFFAPITLNGTASGVVTIQANTAAGTYNFNMPTSAGSLGNYLSSGGGGTVAMSFLGFTSHQQFNFTTGTGAIYTPSATLKAIWVRCAGGGGGGGGCTAAAVNSCAGAGGGGGGYFEKFFLPSGNCTYSIGAAGGGGAAGNNNGTAGGATTFNCPSAINMTAAGGAAGPGGANSGGIVIEGAGGAGGAASGSGDLNITGASGTYAFTLSALIAVGGAGGGNTLSDPTSQNVSGTNDGAAGNKYGGGGGGAARSGSAGQNAGGTGSTGGCSIFELFNGN